MTKVFDKTDSDLVNTYDSALKEWESSGDFEKMSMAVNLRCDHRVTARREYEFRNYFSKRLNLREALDDYARQNVKLTANPDFCEAWCDNLVADYQRGQYCDDYPQDDDLASVVSLNGLSRALMGSYPQLINQMPEWKELIDVDTQSKESGVDGNKFDDWLNNNLEGKSIEQVEQFLTNVFKVLNFRLTEENQHYNPVWATTWSHLTEYAERNADRWNEIVGVPRQIPTWQIVLRYPASRVPCLYRPSQLDGGYFPQHFPSPRQVAKAFGGLTMDLGLESHKPLSEYIHKQIELDIQYWISAGRRIGKTGITSHDLFTMRSNHYGKLISEFEETAIREWMPNPV